MILLHVVDAFTDSPFTGNPAAVAPLSSFPPDDWMQLVAREMNLSETAFVVRRPDGGHDLRWFTPAAEVDLCGHATLATAHVLGGHGCFHTRSGVLTCRPGTGGLIEMDFPSDPPQKVGAPAGFDEVPVREWAKGSIKWLAELPDAPAVRQFAPDLPAISALPGQGLIVTAPGDTPGVDFVSRYFAPAVGVPEDPVTGSAHCTLAPYWAERFQRPELVGFQASARGGTVQVRVAGDRVVLSGRAVTVSEVRLLVGPPSRS